MSEIFPNLVLPSPTEVFLLGAETDLLFSLITTTTNFAAVTPNCPPPPRDVPISHARTVDAPDISVPLPGAPVPRKYGPASPERGQFLS